MSQLLTDGEIDAALAELPHWHRAGRSLVRTIEAPTFPDAIALVDRVAVVAVCWAAVTLIGVPWVLSTAQDSIWDVERPAPLAWLGAVNVVGVLAVYVVMILAGRTGRDEQATTDPSVGPPRRSGAQEPDPTP